MAEAPHVPVISMNILARFSVSAGLSTSINAEAGEHCIEPSYPNLSQLQANFGPWVKPTRDNHNSCTWPSVLSLHNIQERKRVKDQITASQHCIDQVYKRSSKGSLKISSRTRIPFQNLAITSNDLPSL